MKIYLLERRDDPSWDEYRSAVVAAHSKKDAALIHPNGHGGEAVDVSRTGSWVSNSKDIRVEYLGEARVNMKRGVLMVNFRAG